VRRSVSLSVCGEPTTPTLAHLPVVPTSGVNSVTVALYFALTQAGLARDVLWETAALQHGFVTAQQAAELGVSKGALQMMVHRAAWIGPRSGCTGSRGSR